MDRSDSSASALEYALEEYPGPRSTSCTRQSATRPLRLFGAREPAEYVVADCDVAVDDLAMPDGNAFNRRQRERAEAVLERACRLSDAYGREIEPVVRSEDAVEEILASADAASVDHNVVADHCRTTIRPVLGDVPKSLVSRADRPVTVVC